MKYVYSADQFKQADLLHLQREGISSWELMEKAAEACTQWLLQQLKAPKNILVCAGHGNNGGDGLAMARLLMLHGHHVNVYRVAAPHYSADNQTNASLLAADVWLSWEEACVAIETCDLIIDALLGIGSNRKAEGAYADCIQWLQQYAHKTVYSIDLPSGMPADKPFDPQWPIVKATHTLCFEGWKLNLLLPHAAPYAGNVHLIAFGLNEDKLPGTALGRFFDEQQLLPERNRFAHKGQFGHALLIGASTGMWGAALLATEACMRVGAGKTTLAAPEGMGSVLASRLPEAMFVRSGTNHWEAPLNTSGFTAIGVGPGLGKEQATATALKNLLSLQVGPLVLDADALNILAMHRDWLAELGPNCVLTPHLGEFDRLFGPHPHWWSRLETAQRISHEKGWTIVLKNAYTFTFSPLYPYPLVNPSGNAGLAKGGSGDVLTGMITGLLAQGLKTSDAATLAVYLHGLAAEIATQEQATASLLARDVLASLGSAILRYQETSTWE